MLSLYNILTNYMKNLIAKSQNYFSRYYHSAQCLNFTAKPKIAQQIAQNPHMSTHHENKFEQKKRFNKKQNFMTAFYFSSLKMNYSAQAEYNIQHTLDPKYSVFQLSQHDFSAVIKFIASQFVVNQPISAHLGIKQDELIQLISQKIKICCRSGLSFAIKFNGQIVAARMASQHKTCLITEPKTEKGKIFLQILTKIEQTYQPQDPEKTLNIFVTATHRDHHRRGLYHRLVEESEKQWEKRGFNEQYGSSSGIITANFLKKFGYYEKGSIDYDDFVYEGKNPFAGINIHKSMKLMVKKWK